MNTFFHPAFAPYRALIAQTAGARSAQQLSDYAEKLELRHARSGRCIRFSAQTIPASACEYEQGIASTGIVPTRADNLHDYLNALVWLRFPQLKSDINHQHCELLAHSDHERRQRGRTRDRLTLLDESGMLVASPRRELLDLLQEKQWLTLFWEARDDVEQHMQFLVVGHGLLEKCMAPFPGMTAKCLFLHTSETTPQALDKLAAATLAESGVLTLPPLPIQGIPGWSDNNRREVYLDTQIFRPNRIP